MVDALTFKIGTQQFPAAVNGGICDWIDEQIGTLWIHVFINQGFGVHVFMIL